MSPTRKLDLLAECNDQRVPPKQFQETFCNRCRNAECVNARWAGSRWEARMGTQFERLILHPERADPREERWQPIVTQAFAEVTTPEVWNRGAARPAPTVAGWGPPAPLPPEEAPSSPVEGVAAGAAGAGAATPAPAEEPGSAALPRGFQEGPRFDLPTAPRGSLNTAFPAGGVMVDGGSEEAAFVTAPAPTPAAARPAHDPWSIRPRPPNVVERGARIRMGK